MVYTYYRREEERGWLTFIPYMTSLADLFTRGTGCPGR
jgi:hypothetical protein